MTSKTFFLGLAILALSWPSAVLAQLDAPCDETTEVDCVDWEEGIAIAVGSGAPPQWAQTAAQKNIAAQRAAKLDASRNLLELIKGVAISAETTVQDAMVSSDRVTSSIQGRISGLRMIGDPRYFSDGSIQVKVAARLRDVIPSDTYISGPPREIEPPSELRLAPAGVRQINTGTAYTGLIIDARGTGVLPAMAPKVLDPDGREVYGSAYVSREHAVSQGIVGYAKDVEAARENDRVQGNPLVIQAVEASGPNKANLVIQAAHADALREIAQTQNFLRQTRVMIVLD